MGYVKVDRNRVINKINRDFRKAIRKLPEDQAIIYTIDMNPKSSGIEIAKGIYPLHRNNDALVKKIWTERKRQFNLNPDFPDHEIIGATFEVLGLDNKRRLEVYEEFAAGKHAEEAAKFLLFLIKGLQEKYDRLMAKAHDPQLMRRLNAEKRRLRRIVDGY
jgi:hypothetical protein